MTIKNRGNYIHSNTGTVNLYFNGSYSAPPQPPSPSARHRFWLELDRIQHVTVLLGALSMLTLVVLCCWTGSQTALSVSLPMIAIGLVGTVGFGYFYYTERAFE